MANKGKKRPDESIVREAPAAELQPTEFFEIESLNADALDIEELEARLEMAATITELSLYCGADCGVLCGANCASNCVGDCGTNCVGNCVSNCAIDFCEIDGCGTMQIP
ncbi:MAG: hypothetical protein AAF560_14325 [Acidobacteriota bacterium]